MTTMESNMKMHTIQATCLFDTHRMPSPPALGTMDSTIPKPWSLPLRNSGLSWRGQHRNKETNLTN